MNQLDLSRWKRNEIFERGDGNGGTVVIGLW